jgi:glycerol-3-phosphate acyltransferase PlsX
MKVKIGVDVMGTDRGPLPLIKGVIDAVNEFDVDVTIVGDKTIIEQELKKYKFSKNKVNIIHSSEVIEMNESPIIACKQKKDASINIISSLLKNGEIDAGVSGGNTGAVVTSALLTCGTLEGISRPAIAAIFPNMNNSHGCVFLDVGANVDSKPKHMMQFAVMGAVYAEKMLNILNPRVALLSIGEEENKGNDLVIETAKLLKSTSLNFVGNVEGRDILADKADVIVCDGFVGNIVLKFGESIAERFYIGLKNSFIRRSLFRLLGILLAKPVIKDFFRRTDFTEFGAAPLLGIKKPYFISHGSSPSKAIKNAIKTAKEYVEQSINLHIEKRLSEFKNL